MKKLLLAFLFITILPFVSYAGYDLHITKADDFIESKNKPIKLGEWKAFITNNPEFNLTGYAQATHPDTGETIRIEKNGIATWMHPETKVPVYFYYEEGQIAVKNPDEIIIKKMKEIADKLKAKVQGDDGEIY